MKISLMCGGLNRAGLETVVCALALGMRARGEGVGVVSIGGGDLAGVLENAGVDVLILSSGIPRFLPHPLKSFLMALRLSWFLWNRGVDVLNVHGVGTEKIGLLACAIAGVRKKTMVLHSNYPIFDPAHGGTMRKKLRRALARFDGVIAVSERVRSWAVETGMAPGGMVEVVPNGIDLDSAVSPVSREESRRMLGLSSDASLLIQVGRFQTPKNQGVSIKAMPTILKRFPGAKLLLVGDGPAEDSSRELCRDIGVSESVLFMGERRDVPLLLGAADLFLLPSSWEGLPVSMLEAMANGLPVIGSAVSGIEDVISLAPECGLLFPAMDDGRMAGAVIAALGDDRWRRQAGEAGRRLVRSAFGRDMMVESYMRVHSGVLDRA